MNKSIGLSLGVVSALVIWMAVGMTLGKDEQADNLTGSGTLASRSVDNRVLVEVTEMLAEEVTSYIVSNGSAVPDREVVLRAETTGQIDQVLVSEGSYVEEGGVILRLKMDDRLIRQEQANITLQERQRHYAAILNLKEKDFASSTEVDTALTQLKLAEVEVERINLEIEKTYIRAPFSGFIEENIADLGAYVGIGNDLVRIVDNDPLIVNTYISQNDIEFLELGTEVDVVLVNGRQRSGQIRFISPRANEATRTFRVEIAVPNAEGIRTGSSVTARVPRQKVAAHYISAGLLTLNNQGDIGVKTLNLEGLVEFYPVTIITSDVNGMWVSGLPVRARVITSGQGFAPIGQAVRVTMAADTSRRGPSADVEASPYMQGQ